MYPSTCTLPSAFMFLRCLFLLITVSCICDSLSSAPLNFILNLSSLSKSFCACRQPPPFCWRVLPTCVRSVWLSLLYQTHHFRKQIKPVGSKEAVLLMEQMHINFNLVYQFFLICIDRKKVTYYFLIPFVSELLNMLIQVSF